MAEDIRREGMSQGLSAEDAELGNRIESEECVPKSTHSPGLVFRTSLCFGTLSHCSSCVQQLARLLLLHLTHGDGLRSKTASQSKAFLP